MGTVNFLNVENIFYVIYSFFTDLNGIVVVNAIIRFIVGLRPFVLVLCLVLLTIFLYAKIRIAQVGKEEYEMYRGKKKNNINSAGRVTNEKWLKIEQHISSPNPN